MRLLFAILSLPAALLGFSKEPCTPFHMMAHAEYLGAAEFYSKDADVRGEKLRFRTLEAELGMAFYYDPATKEVLDLSLSYLHTTMKWDDNVFFNQGDFNTVAVRLAFFSRRLCNWEWKGFVKMYIEADHPDFQHYLYWDFSLWGFYMINNCTNVHIGVYGEVGMKADHLYPIIGFDWRYSRNVKLSLVFPTDLSLLWIIDDCWNVGIAERFFRQRHRVGHDDPLPMGLWEYSNTGTELGVNYRWGERIIANAHAGWAWGGRLRIDNRYRRDAHHREFHGSPYVGGEASVRF